MCRVVCIPVPSDSNMVHKRVVTPPFYSGSTGKERLDRPRQRSLLGYNSTRHTREGVVTRDPKTRVAACGIRGV